MTSTAAPRGCGASVDPLYYNLCDLDTVWGVAVEVIAAAGAMTSFVLILILVGSLPFATNRRRKTALPLQAAFLVFTLGLFGLTLAFVAGRDSATCAARRFVFGVLFAGCLACLVMHGWWLWALGRGGGGDAQPGGWVLYAGALALWLVEVIVNTEWLIVTVVRTPLGLAPGLACGVANQDFVMALVYVMCLLLAAVLMAVPSLAHKDKEWHRDGAFILATGLVTGAIWAAWIAMYVYGNGAVGKAGWDDATIAIALVCNAWVFVVLYAVPEVCLLSEAVPGTEEEEEQPDGDLQVVYAAARSAEPSHSQVQQNVYMDNKAFAMEEPSADAVQEKPPPEPEKPVPPVHLYNRLRRGVYQPTELALITKGLTYTDFHQNPEIPRPTAPPLNEEDCPPVSAPPISAPPFLPPPISAPPISAPPLPPPTGPPVAPKVNGLNKRAFR